METETLPIFSEKKVYLLQCIKNLINNYILQIRNFIYKNSS